MATGWFVSMFVPNITSMRVSSVQFAVPKQRGMRTLEHDTKRALADLLANAVVRANDAIRGRGGRGRVWVGRGNDVRSRHGCVLLASWWFGRSKRQSRQDGEYIETRRRAAAVGGKGACDGVDGCERGGGGGALTVSGKRGRHDLTRQI
jgi:hypothetical protein